jgi:hypothetical protein
MLQPSLFPCLAGIAFTSSLLAAEPVREKINMLDLMRAGGVEYHVNPNQDVHDAPSDIWRMENGCLHVSGRGYGYMATKQEFCDYHLVLEFKWGAMTWGKRVDRARDNGILLHAFGPHGAFNGSWMAAIEAQIIEGGIGDILALSTTLKGGTDLSVSVTCEIEADRDGENRWKKGSSRKIVTKGRVNWEKRDEDWTDTINFRGRDDLDAPVGGWNRLEVIAKGDTLQYFVNGQLVNEAFDVKPSEGRICLQTEAAEMIVRRYELWPLGRFNEKWNPPVSSEGAAHKAR